MALTVDELPKLVLLIMALGVSGYVTVWLADQLRYQIEAVLR